MVAMVTMAMVTMTYLVVVIICTVVMTVSFVNSLENVVVINSMIYKQDIRI